MISALTAGMYLQDKFRTFREPNEKTGLFSSVKQSTGVENSDVGEY